MAFTHTFNKGWTNGGAPINKAVDVSAGSEINIEESVPTGNLTIGFGVDISALKGLYILASGNLTLRTNDNDSPDDELAIHGNQPLVWSGTDGYFSNPFGADIATLIAENPGAGNVTLQIRALVDPTP